MEEASKFRLLRDQSQPSGNKRVCGKGPGKTTPTKTLSHAGKNALAHRGWSNDARSIDQADYYKTKKENCKQKSVKRLLEIGKLKKNSISKCNDSYLFFLNESIIRQMQITPRLF